MQHQKCNIQGVDMVGEGGGRTVFRRGDEAVVWKIAKGAGSARLRRELAFERRLVEARVQRYLGANCGQYPHRFKLGSARATG